MQDGHLQEKERDLRQRIAQVEMRLDALDKSYVLHDLKNGMIGSSRELTLISLVVQQCRQTSPFLLRS
jgi:hypothetical protein